MLHIGITGGIGSGKTTICRLFETLGIPVYYADDRAKALMTQSPELVSAIKKAFGAETYLADGSLNRAYLREIIFKNEEKRQLLNSLVHPAVLEDGLLWQKRQENCPYTLKEAALLIESQSYLALNKLIVVTAPKDLRVQRVVERDKITIEEVKARMATQLPDAAKLPLADFVIYNDGIQLLIPQVIEIHHFLVSLSAS